MSFDAKSLLQPAEMPKPAPAEPMTVDALAAKFAKISAAGLGKTFVKLPTGELINAVDLVAQGETPAHFVVKHK